MSKTEDLSIWEVVNSNIKETERLLAQRQYNLSMIKARQTAEYMVKALADQAGIPEGDLSHMIDDLYQGRYISKEATEHYHRLRIIGNKAVHESYANASDASRCYQILAQEGYALANLTSRSRRSVGTTAAPIRRSTTPASSTAPARTASSVSSARTGSSTAPSRTSTGSGTGARPAAGRTAPARSSSSIPSRKRSGGGSQSPDLLAYALRLLIPILLIVIIVLVVRLVLPKEKSPDVTTAPTTTELLETTPATPTEPEPTVEPDTQPVAVTYKTTTTVNVRPQPSTDVARLGKLDSGATVQYISDYDDFWAIIQYNGQEAYIAKEFIAPAE